MSKAKTEKADFKKEPKKSRAAEIANTFEWLITAFVLALLFMAFVMQAFRIPTGSMADTLKGAHFRLRCPQCGYEYDYGFIPERYGLPQDTIPRGYLKAVSSRCPSCGHYQLAGGAMSIANGDRILVLKCIYQFFEPKRWDVVVFKNPLNPTINYIKRLIGRPGEKVEIIDGDVYINEKISRKPPKVQNELWMPIYDNDYQPARPEEPCFNGHAWRQPFKNSKDSEWKFGENSHAIFRLDTPPAQVNWLFYDTSTGNDFRATYAYNDVEDYANRTYCSDLMVRFYAGLAKPDGSIGVELSKYQTNYKASVDFTGDMVIEAVKAQEHIELARKPIEPPIMNKPTLVKFANVDHQLILEFGREKLTYDLGRNPEDAGPRETNIQPQAKIFGSGSLTLSHIAIFRDIHYTEAKFANHSKSARAMEGNPFELEEDEFFMLGDNSPSSQDSRWWSEPGKGNNGRSYRPGIVPRDYLIGKALCVYWPSWFRPLGKASFVFIPNVGQVRLIYGGTGKEQ